MRSQWWAYPTGWPDSATEVHMKLGGYYDPAHTISISDGQMHIRLFRDTGPIHSAAAVPKAAIGMMYGKYVERFRVSNPRSSTGYKSSHLLWPASAPLKYEVDYPEGEWDSNFCVHVHSVSAGQRHQELLPGRRLVRELDHNRGRVVAGESGVLPEWHRGLPPDREMGA